MTSETSITLDDAEAFLFREARLLDENSLDEWLAMATDDFVYWIPVNDDEDDPSSHLSIIYNNKKECEERAFRVLNSGLNHPQDPPSRTARFVTNVEVAAGANSEPTLRCNLLLHEYRPHAQRVLHSHEYAARCEYRLRRDGADWKMTYKKVALVNMDGSFQAMTYFL